jgi:hypothetical protein
MRDRLFRERLSETDLRQLTTSCDVLPVRTEEWVFTTDLLEFMVRAFVRSPDRESLVTLLSKRCPTWVDWPTSIEYYLARHGGRLKSPMSVLGDAYFRCQAPETRRSLAAAVRRGFVDLGIDGTDDADYVKHAMQCYEKEKDHWVVNSDYTMNETGGGFSVDAYERFPELYDNPKGHPRYPLFKAKTFANETNALSRPWIIFWLIHVVIAMILSYPIVLLGRKRVRWSLWELLATIIPFGVWMLLTLSEFGTKKETGNLIEGFCLALGVPIAATVRVGIGSRVPQRICAAALIALLCVAAVALFFLVPPLPILE